MSFKMKTADTDTIVRDDGATSLGIVLGTLIGAGLAYWWLAMNSPHNGMIIVLSVTAGTFIGAFIGYLIGRFIDKRLAPWIENIVMNAADKSKEAPRRWGLW